MTMTSAKGGELKSETKSALKPKPGSGERPAKNGGARHKDAIPIVASDKLARIQVQGMSDASVRWAGAFAGYGGPGTTQSSPSVYQIEPGPHLARHTRASDETPYIHNRHRE